jgi:protein N-terminal methyltransferase
MSLMPELCTVPSALRSLDPPVKTGRIRALDVGAGVGRVTSDTLLPLVDDVVLLEPVDIFIREAIARGKASESDDAAVKGRWKGIQSREKSVTFVKGTLQDVDPVKPDANGDVLARIGAPLDADGEMESGFDVIWCQWCLGHLSDPDLVDFFKRAQKGLRTRQTEKGEAPSLIVVKENLCSDGEDGSAKTVYDEQDSSLTRWVACQNTQHPWFEHYPDRTSHGRRSL